MKDTRFLPHRKSFTLHYDIHRLILYRKIISTCTNYVTRPRTVCIKCRPSKYWS